MMLLLSLVTQTRRIQQTQKKALINRKKSAAHRSVVNRFVELPSSTDDIVETVTKNLLEIQKNVFSAFMKVLSRICYLARTDCLYAAIMILNQIFVN